MLDCTYYWIEAKSNSLFFASNANFSMSKLLSCAKKSTCYCHLPHKFLSCSHTYPPKGHWLITLFSYLYNFRSSTRDSIAEWVTCSSIILWRKRTSVWVQLMVFAYRFLSSSELDCFLVVISNVVLMVCPTPEWHKFVTKTLHICYENASTL